MFVHKYSLAGDILYVDNIYYRGQLMNIIDFDDLYCDFNIFKGSGVF